MTTTINAVSHRRIPLTVNSGKTAPVYPETTDDVIRKQEDLPVLFYGETVIFCLRFLDSAGNGISFGSDDIFELSIDCNFVHGDDPLMAFSAGSDCVNVPGDWESTDPAHGLISIRVNCATAGFAGKIGNLESIPVRIEVKRSTAGETSHSVLMSSSGIARNTVHMDENAPVSADPEYYNAAQISAILSGHNTDAAAHPGKASLNHTHTKNDITDFPAIPRNPSDIGAAPAEHTHTKNEITDFLAIPTTAADIGAAPANHTHDYDELNNKPIIPTTPEQIGAAPLVHTHNYNELTGLPAHITETWHSEDGKAWYRHYSDNWVEQGGVLSTDSAVAVPIAVNFPVAFADMNFSLLKTFINDASNAASFSWVGVLSRTTTNFQTLLINTIPGSWFACGYAA